MRHRDRRKYIVCALPVVAALTVYAVAALYGRYVVPIGMPCWFNLYTGYLCPGCGGTRSFYALLHGDVLASLQYNAFVPVVALFGVVAYARAFLRYVLGRPTTVFPRDDRWVYVPLVGFLAYFFLRNVCV